MVGYNPWGPKELDTIECARTHLTEETRMIYIYYFKSYHMLFIRMIVKIVSISLKEEKENLTSPIELYIGYDFLMTRFGKQKTLIHKTLPTPQTIRDTLYIMTLPQFKTGYE